MNLKSITLAVICLIAVFRAFSQAPVNYAVKGIITDSLTQKPVDYVTVGLKNSAKQPVKSVLTKTDGSFLFDKLAAGKYSLTVILVGYAGKTIAIDVTDNTKILDLGNIALTAQSSKLKEVVITAERPLIKQDIDKLTYDIQADPENKVNNVLEMMRKIPMLTVDAEDNVKLKGESNYKILINGKPSSMMENNPKDILKSMPASSIQNIEIITNPPSKYDSEGLAGIINIITNKKVDNGYNGSLNLNGQAPTTGGGISGNINLKEGKFGITGYGSISERHNPLVNSNFSRESTLSTLTQARTNEYDAGSR